MMSEETIEMLTLQVDGCVSKLGVEMLQRRGPAWFLDIILKAAELLGENTKRARVYANILENREAAEKFLAAKLGMM